MAPTPSPTGRTPRPSSSSPASTSWTPTTWTTWSTSARSSAGVRAPSRSGRRPAAPAREVPRAEGRGGPLRPVGSGLRGAAAGVLRRPGRLHRGGPRPWRGARRRGARPARTCSDGARGRQHRRPLRRDGGAGGRLLRRRAALAGGRRRAGSPARRAVGRDPAHPRDVTADPDVKAALGTAQRDEWGRLLALLVARYRRLDLAEDGLADAFEAASRTWPADGVPTSPGAWLLVAARRRITDRLRAEAVANRKLPLLAVEAGLTEEAQRTMADPGERGAVADERLRLVLLCAHPSLPREGAAALTLRLVLGVTTEDLARLFLVRTSTMAARLTRARKGLAGESFTVPSGTELADRVRVVSDVAYLAFTAGYAPGSGPDVLRADVAAEAIRLVRVLRDLLPEASSEVDALLALMLLQHSRRDARVAGDGRLVLLPDQDRQRWYQDEIKEAVELLTPLAHADPAPYLLQALVAAEHAIAGTAEQTDWSRIVARYDELLGLADSPVVRLNRAVAVGEADGPLAGLAALDGLPDDELPGPRLPAARAELLARAGRADEARAAYDAAIDRCANEAERAHLEERRGVLRS